MNPALASVSTTKRGALATNVTKRVVVLASGETERRALPHLVRHLADQGVVVDSIRIPPRHRRLDVFMAERLIKTVWYEDANARPRKFVVLVDADYSAPNEVLAPIQAELPDRVGDIATEAHIQVAYAQQHLEAWYFADSQNLREFIGRDVGNVDASRPDRISNPKNHLKNLLAQRVYTAGVSEEIASRLSTSRISERSPSFRSFISALLNGDGRPSPTPV